MNIPEILVANGTGAVLVSFLLLLRVRAAKVKTAWEQSCSAGFWW